MAHIDPTQPGRTVHNCTVYDARKVYEIETSATLDEVRSVYGTGEVERTGNKVTERRTYHVVAKNEDLARACFRLDHNPDRFTIITVKPLFVIDCEITTRRD